MSENDYLSKPNDNTSETGKELPGPEAGSDGTKNTKTITVEDLRNAIPHDDSAMLDFLVTFLREFLVCDEYQLHLLALWIVHTWTFQEYVTTAAYLDIRSPEPESGKTRCLELLKLFAHEPWSASGPTPRTIILKLIENRDVKQIEQEDGFLCFPFSILLDDCHHIFRPSERQQLLAMLNSGSRRTSRYVLDDTEYCLFRPMAFAANTRLPRSLAARCIPIVMSRKKPSDTVARFHPVIAQEEAGEILEWLEIIGMSAKWNSNMIEQAPATLPTNWVLTAHQEDCAEPLLLIAEAIGGPWPERARNAIVACFSLAEYSSPIQMLADVRASFRMMSDPEYLLSRDLLPFLGAMESRPWAGWNNNSGRKLVNLLKPFGISSRKLTTGDEPGIMCYRFEDFQDAWERYLQQPNAETAAAAGSSSSAGND